MADTPLDVGAGKKEASIEMVEVGVEVGNMEDGCGKDCTKFETQRRRAMVGCDGYCAVQNGLDDPNVVGQTAG